MKIYLSIMLMYWFIADRDATFSNSHRTTAFLHRTTTFRTTRRASDYYMWCVYFTTSCWSRSVQGWNKEQLSSLIWLVSGHERSAEPFRRSNHNVVPIRDIQEKKSKYFATFKWSHGVLKIKTNSMLHIHIPPLFTWNRVKWYPSDIFKKKIIQVFHDL